MINSSGEKKLIDPYFNTSDSITNVIVESNIAGVTYLHFGTSLDLDLYNLLLKKQDTKITDQSY